MTIDSRKLLEKGVFVGRMTDRSALDALAMALRPVRTAHSLIRYGGESDGGYLVPDDLEGIEVCFSPGVGEIAHFEEDLLQRTGIVSHLTDASVVRAPASLKKKSFLRRYLGCLDSDTHITLDSWMKRVEDLSTGQDFILQMDIEGSEYLSILATPEHQLRRFRVILLEIHDVKAWGNPPFFGIVKAFFDKLLQHFVVVHNHPNNCCPLVNLGGFVAPEVFELTLHRKDRVKALGYASSFPHPLDRGNLDNVRDLVLPRNWWGPVAAPESGKVTSQFDFLAGVSGVIHVGANAGQERDIYDSLGLTVLWVEAIPALARKVRRTLASYPLQECIECLLTDQDGKDYPFNVSNNYGASSSIYDFALHKDLWPSVVFVEKIMLRSRTFEKLAHERHIDMSMYAALVLDVQGSELLVLKGFGRLIDSMKFVLVEAAEFEAYAGGCRLDQLTEYLAAFGFRELRKTEFARHPTGGAYSDVLFGRD